MAWDGQSGDPGTQTIGPVVYQINERGEVKGTELARFEPTTQNLLSFGWWRHITSQLDLPPVLPEEPVAPGATWKSTATLSGPDGKPMHAACTYRLLGTSYESSGLTAWIRDELMLPIKLRFRSDDGRYDVNGQLRVDRIHKFDVAAKLPTGYTEVSTLDLSVDAESEYGDEYGAQLVAHGQGKAVIRAETKAEADTEIANKPNAQATHDPNAAMAQWMELNAKGPAHKKFERLVGTWDAEMKAWMPPNGELMVTKGTAEFRLILDGRYVEQIYRSDFMGMPFEGRGLEGFDNIRKQYISTWMDNQSTGIYIATGTADPSGKVITYHGKMDDPSTGEMGYDVRTVARDVSEDEIVFEMHRKLPNGNELKTMQITYKRRK